MRENRTHGSEGEEGSKWLFSTPIGYMDVYRLPSMALDTGFPAGMTVYLTFVYNDERQA